MILLFLLLVPLFWLIAFKYKRRKMYRLAAAIPDLDESLPLIGIAHTLTGNTEDIMEALQRYSYTSMKYDGVVKAWLGHLLYFVVVNPVDLEVIMKSCLEKDNLHRFLQKLIGFGAIFAPVPIWRRRRKILVPTFSPKIVEGFVNIFAEQSQKLAQMLSCWAEKGKFSVWPHLTAYTLDSVCDTTMGVKINAQENSDSPFLNSLTRILNIMCERIFHLWLQPDWMFKFFPQYIEHQECIKMMHTFTDEVIKKKRVEMKVDKESKTEADHHYDLEMIKTKTFLDVLIQNSGGERGYTNVELREEILTLSIAGTDTSAGAIGYTLKLLAKYPEVQEKVYQELHDVYGESDRPLVKEDYTKLKYLERVVKESLRLFPPVPFIIRKVLEDIKLPSGRVLPAGSGIVISLWGVHRDPKYWGPDAEHFDPDRFLPERFNLPHSCCYMPFSSGPRNCLGYQYALMSVKTALASILRRYKVVGEPENGSIPKIKVKLDVMMKAVDGYQIALERRNSTTTVVS